MLKERVLIIGLDGGTFNIINPLIENDKLPNLKQLITEGVSGVLESTIPPITAPAWTSFMTGRSPARNNVLDFRKYDLRKYNCYLADLISSYDIQGKTFLESLSQRGLRVFSVGLPMTYPPFPINGVMISGFPTPSSKKAPVYPDELANQFGRWDEMQDPSDFKRPCDKVIESLNFWAKRYANSAKQLLRENDFDVFIFVMSSIDHASHLFWRYQNEATGPEQYQRVIQDQYILADSKIGELIKLANAYGDISIFIVSDHGFGPSPTLNFHLNSWLRDKGFINLKGYSVISSAKSSFARKMRSLKTQIARSTWLSLRSKVPRKLKEFLYTSSKMLDIIDWSKTRAYRVPLFANIDGININVLGRQKNGCVRGGSEYETTRETIIDLLKQVKLSGGVNLVQKISKKEELFPQSCLDNVPDIIVRYHNNLASVDGVKGSWLSTPQKKKLESISGQHRSDGIFIARGSFIKRGHEITSAKLVDIAPTILRYFGLPIPHDMDGRVLTEIYRDLPMLQRDEQGKDGLVPKDQKDRELTSEEKEEIIDRLKNLGYL